MTLLRTIFSSLLSLLLVATLLWGGCISCEQYFMVSGAKTCCAPSGQCKSKLPGGQKKTVDCKQIALEHQKSIDVTVALPMVNPLWALVPPVLPQQTRESWNAIRLIDTSPPNLQVLNSTFLL